MGGHAPVNILSVSNLTRTYGSLRAVDGLDFAVRKGEIFGVSGPNGAGKTTMFDLVSGATPATSGQIRFNGCDILAQGPDAVCQAGLVRTFQLNAAFSGLTLFESVLVGATFGSDRAGFRTWFGTDRRARRRAQEAIDFVGLGAVQDTRAGQANVFDLKRTMIACALATEPKLLLMDEPVGGLVPDEIDRIAGLVQRLRDTGITIMLIEHVMRFLTALSDRILVMHHGSALFEGSPDDMMRNSDVRDVYLGKSQAGPGHV